jgi:hypothetical protein
VETWSLTLRKERRLRVFKNRLLRRIFGLKANYNIGGCRILRHEEFHKLCSSPSIINVNWIGLANDGES